MAIREIVLYPNDILKHECSSVTEFDITLDTLIEDMAETMYAAPGAGLAANQIGIDAKVCIVDISDHQEKCELHVFVNPKIIRMEGEIEWQEACLSFPDVSVNVTRSQQVTVEAQNAKGEFFTLEATGYFAVAIQHEIDHLNGISLADKMSFLRKKMMTKDLQKRKQMKKRF